MPLTTDEQIQFLVSCIRYSNNGKVDFEEVAKDCNIVTKAAAAKRYERLMKAQGLHSSGSPASPSVSTNDPTASNANTPTKTPRKRANATANPKATKTGTKRKAAGKTEDDAKRMKMKDAAVVKAEEMVEPLVKKEAGDSDNADDTLFDQFCNADTTGSDGEDDMEAKVKNENSF